MREGRLRESDIQRDIMSYLKMQGVFCWVNKTQGTYDPRKKCFRANTTMRGVPDIICVIEGKFVGLEVKAPKGKQSKHQKDFEDLCKRAGGEYYVVRSIEETKASLSI